MTLLKWQYCKIWPLLSCGSKNNINLIINIIIWSHKNFLLQNNLSVSQTMLIFYLQRGMCVNFLKKLINIFRTIFIFINVGR